MLHGIDHLRLGSAERIAVLEAEQRLKKLFPVDRVIVFGSAARGKADDESDIDLLVITSKPATHAMRDAMSDEIFEVNLEHGTNLSIVVVEARSWESGLLSSTPLHAEIARDGVML